jgi:hypothetical protein
MAAVRPARLSPDQGQDLPVVVALGSVDPALVSGVLDVLAGREPRAVADPAWRSHRTEEYS